MMKSEVYTVNGLFTSKVKVKQAERTVLDLTIVLQK